MRSKASRAWGAACHAMPPAISLGNAQPARCASRYNTIPRPSDERFAVSLPLCNGIFTSGAYVSPSDKPVVGLNRAPNLPPTRTQDALSMLVAKKLRSGFAALATEVFGKIR